MTSIWKGWLIIVFLVHLSELSPACDVDEAQCSNKECILKERWCDGEIDCFDASDESDCALGPDSNTSGYLKSDNEVIVEAATYILSQRKADYGWDDFTPRALIALAFAKKVLPLPKDNSLMLNRLDVQIHLDLMRNEESLVDLALSINALYAMCEDPRNFHGLDLVSLLRSATDTAMKGNFNLLVVLMTLCLAKETKPKDFQKLIAMYDENSDILGFKALAAMAIIGCRNEVSSARVAKEMNLRMKNFSRELKMEERTDIYTKALILQTLIALKYNVSHYREDLLSYQLKDGSFGDLLATYHVMPVLLNTSLLNLKCKKSGQDIHYGTQMSDWNHKSEIKYSMWISDGDVTSHTLVLPIQVNTTFYEVMKQAEQRNPMFRFMCDGSKLGKKVYCLGGLPNDAERGMLWKLYRGKADSVVDISKKGLKEETNGVDQIFPVHGDHFIFWMQRSST